MRGNLLVVARVGGSEILRPRVQRGGERSVGVKFPNISPKIFFAFGLHRERAEIAAGGARRAQEPLLFFRVFFCLLQPVPLPWENVFFQNFQSVESRFARK